MSRALKKKYVRKFTDSIRDNLMQKRFGMPYLSEIARSFFPPHDSGVSYMHAKMKKYWLMFVMNSLASMHPERTMPGYGDIAKGLQRSFEFLIRASYQREYYELNGIMTEAFKKKLPEFERRYTSPHLSYKNVEVYPLFNFAEYKEENTQQLFHAKYYIYYLNSEGEQVAKKVMLSFRTSMDGSKHAPFIFHDIDFMDPKGKETIMTGMVSDDEEDEDDKPKSERFDPDKPTNWRSFL